MITTERRSLSARGLFTMFWAQDELLLKPHIYQIVFGSVCGGAALLLLSRWMERRSYQAKIRKARSNREKALREMERAAMDLEESKQSGVVESILSLSLHELHEKLQRGVLTPDSVLHAYMKKALEVNKQLNCLTDFLPDCRTQVQDAQVKQKGLLYGIPVSIKDNIDYKGHDSTCGLRKFLNWPATKDSVVVQVLKKQGAVPFVKTNLPQSLLSYECSNPIFGQTVNPHDAKRTSGGSSGGEAALIAAGGSILGIGSDIGGSVRVPASFCGICGFKPTGKRLSYKGLKMSVPGQKFVETAIGPLARDVDSLALCMKALLCEDMFYLDSTVPPLPFNDEVYSSSKPLRIGYYESDGLWIPLPCMKRAIMETKQLLEEAGHTLVPFTPLKPSYAFKELVIKGLGSAGSTVILEKLKGDIIDPNLKDLLYVYKMPPVIKKIMSFLLKPFSRRMADILKNLCGIGSVSELWKHQTAVEAYCEEYVNLWKSKKLDVLLCPALGPAFSLGYAGKLTVSSSSKIIFNLLNFPAGVVPVGMVTEKDEEELKDYVGYCNDFWDRSFKKAVSGAVGLPLAVQCVALPWQDELCLRFMKEVERVVQKKKGI
ncbi:fatty-acid amide hydrolase 1 [Pristis pectinata]|uniref:fatty-acid amide hydrolase 1 n=1 Tax=Pristis pectinata TaxID=685728 RepID=UPI00223D43AB|nr:fatty-acid amide hydrolase 1 [Pristis pectinata]